MNIHCILTEYLRAIINTFMFVKCALKKVCVQIVFTLWAHCVDSGSSYSNVLKFFKVLNL